jgi:hypothetical protein
LKPTFKKNPTAGKSAGGGPKLPNYSIPPQKNNVDNKTRFSYQDGYGLCLKQLSIFHDSSTERHVRPGKTVVVMRAIFEILKSLH